MKKLFTLLLALALCACSLSAMAVEAVSSATVGVEVFPEIPEHQDATTLVIYFSTNDTVKAVALTAAEAVGADVFEVVPEQPYTEADLAYYTGGRCDQEQADDAARPAIAVWPESLDSYEVIFIGYPIWHGQAPKILYTLLEGIDVSGKTIVPFCTSMSSGAGSSASNLQKAASDTSLWQKATRMDNGATAEQIGAWAQAALAEVSK